MLAIAALGFKLTPGPHLCRCSKARGWFEPGLPTRSRRADPNVPVQRFRTSNHMSADRRLGRVLCETQHSSLGIGWVSQGLDPAYLLVSWYRSTKAVPFHWLSTYPFSGVTRGLDPIGAKIRGVSRAQRSASRRRVVRCRPGIVTHTTFAKVPEQRRTASLCSRCTASGTRNVLILAPMGLDPRVYPLRKTRFANKMGLHRNSGLPEFRITASRKSGESDLRCQARQ
jgi:hypothetical protein